eukprot:gnl/MRDRNA2_/MRDRNA2_88797_c0_seq1.p1 gnl/MRDRNA2_/MRDRNA2_88797_c0~~gnl/MRDRNA2_/MRDRNA2_88797_c0_seq1.p1  ORF type:complete len:309 (+),score=69.23 gnl/MRDRNA2_/MRDRNA2_88797_c0_seq1:73-999(+)
MMMGFNMKRRELRRQQAKRKNCSPSNQMICTAVYPMQCEEVRNACPPLNFEAATTAVVQAAVAQWLQEHDSSNAGELHTCDSMRKNGNTYEEMAQQHEKPAPYEEVAQEHETQAKHGMHSMVVQDMHESEYSWVYFKEQVDAIQDVCAHEEEEHRKMIHELQQHHQKASARLKELLNDIDCTATTLKEHMEDSCTNLANDLMLYECDSTCEPSECNSEESSASDITLTQQILVHEEAEVVTNANRVPRLQISLPITSSCRPSLAPSFPVASFPPSLSSRNTARFNPPMAPPFPLVPPPSSKESSRLAP